MVVDRHRERALRFLLADDVLVEHVVDLARLRQVLEVERRRRRQLLVDDLVAEIDALVADVDARAGDQLLDLALRLPAEAAEKLFVRISRACHVSPRGRATESLSPVSSAKASCDSVDWPLRRQIHARALFRLLLANPSGA